MQNTAASLIENTERFFRWVYPGLLFLVLLHLSRLPNQFGIKPSLLQIMGLSQESDAIKIFSLITAVIVTSIVIYGIQRYVIQEVLVEYVFFYLSLGWGHAAAQAGFPKERWRKKRLTPCAALKWSAEFQRIRFGKSADRHLLDYVVYSWAVTLSLGMSWWMILIAYCRAGSGSDLGKTGFWVWALVVPLLVAWVWQEIRNEQLDVNIAKRYSHL